MSKYLPRREVLKILGIHYQTLHNMVKRNDIELLKIGTKHYYNLDKYLHEKGQNITHKDKKIFVIVVYHHINKKVIYKIKLNL